MATFPVTDGTPTFSFSYVLPKRVTSNGTRDTFTRDTFLVLSRYP